MGEDPIKQTESVISQEVNSSNIFASRLMAFSGYMMLTGTIILLVFLVWILVKSGAAENTYDEKNMTMTVWIMQQYGHSSLVLLGSGITGYLGIKLLGAAGERTVIPPQDYKLLAPLIKEGKKEAIEQYVILSSLGGFTGTFQKIGFSGLPLATAVLTIIFSIFTFFKPEFLDLAKLTLGAFIGSFVQKGQTVRSDTFNSSNSG